MNWTELTTRFLLLSDSAGLLRTDLSFTIAAGPRQRSHSRVRVPWYSWPYFTLSDSGLPFSSPPTTRMAKVEVFDPASTRDTLESVMCLLVITSRRTEHRSSSRTVPLLLSVFLLLWNVPSDLIPSNGGLSTVDCLTSGTCLPNRLLSMVKFITIKTFVGTEYFWEDP
jgi:hypothetical protein